MTSHHFDGREVSEKLSVDQYFQWIQQQPETDRDRFELVEGKVHSLLSSTEQMQRLRLLQWQLQHFLELRSKENLAITTAEPCQFEVHIRPSIQFSKFSYLKPAILVRKDDRESLGTEDFLAPSTVWIIDIVESFTNEEDRIQLYAQAGIANYWSIEQRSAELKLYQQPNASGYQSHRVLQVGDRATPNSVPITVMLQESVPLYFMTRTLRGQQTYESNALPFAFSRG